jgi:hypothetical protein
MVKPYCKSKERYQKILGEHVEELSSLQRLHYAFNRYALLLIFQGTDSAGKDGAIRHVMPGVNPQGCQVFSFKQPSAEELEHDFLWRTAHRLPERGRIGIFNRSYYEEVLAPLPRHKHLIDLFEEIPLRNHSPGQIEFATAANTVIDGLQCAWSYGRRRESAAKTKIPTMTTHKMGPDRFLHRTPFSLTALVDLTPPSRFLDVFKIKYTGHPAGALLG